MKLEAGLGPVTESCGGRADIVVKDGKGHTIIIENKIYAGDQAKQMQRYRNSDAKAHLFYLTLKSNLPSHRSEAELERSSASAFMPTTFLDG